MATKQTTQILKRLRSLMKDTTVVPEAIQAYIVPSGDAHQVYFFYFSQFLVFFLLAYLEIFNATYFHHVL